MTIDFICGVLAELFDSPCNFSPMDEYMFQDEYCEHHCGKVEDKDCWKRYFEKRWEDSKVSEIPTNSEKPNNCETCLYRTIPWDAPICDSCTTANSHYEKDEFEPKTEPQTEMVTDCPWGRGEDEPQNERSGDGSC